MPQLTLILLPSSVIGREEISVRAGTYKAIKADLRLERVGKHLELEPHRKFRRATIWVSDDRDRILLRIEAQIFVGTVFAELQSVRFDGCAILMLSWLRFPLDVQVWSSIPERPHRRRVGRAEDACVCAMDRRPVRVAAAIIGVRQAFGDRACL